MNKKKNISLIQLFSHLEGIAVVPTVNTLFKNGIIDTILTDNEVSLKSLSLNKKAQMGYLNVALNTFASLGAMEKTLNQNDSLYHLTSYGKEYFKLIENYSFYEQIDKELHNFIINDIKTNDLNEFINKVEKIVDVLYCKLKNLHSSNTDIHSRIAHHIEGVLIYPILLYISHQNLNDTDTANLEELIKKILSQDNKINVDEIYKYILSKSKSYGVTASYQPIFSNLDKIIFKNENLIYSRKKNEKEIHVNRRLNVWGSGGAHKTYFKKIDKIVIDIFNMPIDSQPSGIADMGCGDGMFLEHLYQLILNETIRGKHLETHPLTLIAADLNQEALEVVRKNLTESNIECNFLIADISNPDKYKNDLKSNFNINIDELLHVRSFLDHNRIYRKYDLENKIDIKSMCAYAYNGEYLTPDDITSNLINHFSSWKKYINKHGLLLLELHGLNPELSRKNKSQTPTIAYEATHGYSDQFIVEYEIFLKCAQFAGLKKVEKHSKVFPNEELITISLNIFK